MNKNFALVGGGCRKKFPDYKQSSKKNRYIGGSFPPAVYDIMNIDTYLDLCRGFGDAYMLARSEKQKLQEALEQKEEDLKCKNHELAQTNPRYQKHIGGVPCRELVRINGSYVLSYIYSPN